jgi:single-stranded-DNA-specific exonuclease
MEPEDAPEKNFLLFVFLVFTLNYSEILLFKSCYFVLKMKIEILNDDVSLSLLDRLLAIRNITDKEKFLYPTWKNSWYDPFLLDTMDKAVDKIIQSIKNNERIVVFGDYDVDGVTSTYVVFYFLYKFLGYKNVSIRLPSRQDGY